MLCVKCKAELPDGAIFCPMCGKRQMPEPRRALKRANGMGTVYKLSGRRRRPWVAAKKHVVIGYYETKTAALEALDKLTGRTLDERYNMSFAEVYAAWNAEHFKEITPQVQAQYGRAYNAVKSLHRRKFRDLRTADFQSALASVPTQSYATLAKTKQLLTQMSTWAKREEIIATSFATFAKLPDKPKKEKDTFSEEEIKKLIADGSDAAKVVLMLIGTGMRINELFTLPVADYHETYCIGGLKTEAGKNRVIPIQKDVRPYFAECAAAATNGLLISGYRVARDSNNFRGRDYKSLLKKLEIPYKSPHATRHTYASRAAAAGMRPEILQKILGHVDYSTTANIYVHANIDELIQAVEVL